MNIATFLAVAASAIFPLDFEQSGEKVACGTMKFRRPRAETVSAFASSGSHALMVSWDPSHRMGFTIRIPETDFTPYDLCG